MIHTIPDELLEMLFHKPLEPLYCPYCKRNIVPDEYGLYTHDLIDHPIDFNIADYFVRH